MVREKIDADVSELLPMIQDTIFGSCNSRDELIDKEKQIIELTEYLTTCRIYELINN